MSPGRNGRAGNHGISIGAEEEGSCI